MNEQFETKEVVIKKLVTGGLQIRVEMNEDCIEECADIYRTWDDRKTDDRLPPITVYYDSMGDEYYLADGFHRVIAAKRAWHTEATTNPEALANRLMYTSVLNVINRRNTHASKIPERSRLLGRGCGDAGVPVHRIRRTHSGCGPSTTSASACAAKSARRPSQSPRSTS